MKNQKVLIAVAMAYFPMLAEAQDVTATIPVNEVIFEKSVSVPLESFVQGYYVATNKLHSGGDTISGNGGFGIASVIAVGKDVIHPFLIGDYQQTNFKKFDQKVNNIRFGMGVQLLNWLGAYAEYADIKFNNKLDGLGVHVRFTPVAGPVNMMFQIGYLNLKNNKGPDLNGADFEAGLSVPFAQKFSGLFNYRATVLSPKNGGDSLAITDFRVGVRFDLK